MLLVQFAGLNPMGNRSPPRAGCPKGNIHRVLADLVQGAGFTVVSLNRISVRAFMQQQWLLRPSSTV